MLYLVMVTLGEGDLDRGVKEECSVIIPSPLKRNDKINKRYTIMNSEHPFLLLNANSRNCEADEHL